MDLMNKAQALTPELIRIRRHLHENPELGLQEVKTQAFVIEQLKAIGAEIITYPGQNAVVGILKSGEAGKCVALRADMDALPVCENSGLEYASKTPGIMHACGHDAHMTIALGAAMLLADCRQEWQGEVRLLFEPDEEGHGGGQDMVAQGCMDGVDAVLGLHMNPDYPAGTIYSKPGSVSGSSDTLFLTFTGKGCHGAYPERGVDAILMAAQALTALQSLVSRNVSPLDSAVITFGTIEGGTANNVICPEVKLKGTLRTLRPETRAFLKERIKAVCEGVAQAMGGKCEVTIRPSYGSVYNDEHLHTLLEKEVGDRLVRREYPSLGVESFCYFVEKAPGLYYDLGSGKGTALHTDTFMVDESCLPIGAALQATLVMEILKGE